MNEKIKHRTLNCRGTLLNLNTPIVMGILNVTPDSFSDGGQFLVKEAALQQVGKMLDEGADIIDIGAYSSRPGAQEINAEEELGRLDAVVPAILEQFPKAILSLDTFRSEVAGPMLEQGIHIINDISAGTHDAAILDLAAKYDAPYMLMHMQGKPKSMQQAPTYADVVEEVCDFFVERINAARNAGVKDIVLDPGFGFGKAQNHNYQLFRNLEQLQVFGLPILVGMSRKSMLYKMFDTTPDDVLELASALHMKALDAGANILRVHDVKAAKRIIQLQQYLLNGAV